MKKVIVNEENPNGKIVDLSTEEIALTEIHAEKSAKEEIDRANDIANYETLKASAKAKLIAGEALTEEEANTIVL